MKLSKIISAFFHPINFPIAGAILYFLLLPKYLFIEQERFLLIVIFVITYIFPLILIFLLKSFKMIDSYHMVTIEERKFPLLLFISITIFIGYWLLKSTVVNLLSLFYFGYGLGLIITYVLLYFKIKVSLHTSAISGLIGFIICFSFYYKVNLIILLVALLLLDGILATSRLRLNAHKLNEVIIGFFLGLLSQFLVYFIYIM
ncbi:hypothetical protein [Lutibacter sp.]|uniref:hypothetical protein n=1 Tax=Lutibacter sp. TaxID=1925666 RepID=UPI0025B988BF|nr:hypothetical protein [Lutibacter sp.]MCF6180404.1 hypothetical protein [Lutibacter sp.]